MSLVKFVQGKEDNLPSKAENGAIYFTTDECIYLGLADGTYKIYGNFVTVDTVDNLPESSNSNVLYYVKAKNALYKYDSENLKWTQVTISTDTTYTINASETKGSLIVVEKDADGNVLKEQTINVVDVASLEESIQTLQQDTHDLDVRMQTNEGIAENLGKLSTMDVVTPDVVSDELLEQIHDAQTTYELMNGQADGYVKLVGRNKEQTIIYSNEVQVVEIDIDGNIVVIPDEAKGIRWGTF